MKKLLLIVSALVLTNCTVIGPTERGVRLNFGSPSEDVKSPGLYLWIPVIVGMETIETSIQKSQVETSAASKDMQEIKTEIAVNWGVTPDQVVTLVKTVGDENDVYERIISPAVSEVLKAESSKRTAEEILTKRLEMKKDIDSELASRLSKYGITMHDVSIVNLTFSHDFTQAIEQKQIAEQEAKRAFYVTEKATQDAKAAVETAKGQAASQQLVKASITPELLQKMAIEKWNGQFPQVMGSGTLPFINLKVNNTEK